MPEPIKPHPSTATLLIAILYCLHPVVRTGPPGYETVGYYVDRDCSTRARVGLVRPLRRSVSASRRFSRKAARPRRVDRSSRYSRLNFTQSPLEKSTLAVIGDQLQRSLVAVCRFFTGSNAAQQIRARGMQ